MKGTASQAIQCVGCDIANVLKLFILLYVKHLHGIITEYIILQISIILGLVSSCKVYSNLFTEYQDPCHFESKMNVVFRVNGRKGWGFAEWDYRHHGGRPRAYSVTDPAWTADLVKG